MNNKTYAAAAFAAIIVISCYWLYFKKETITNTFPYQVIWQLDSVEKSNDTARASNQLLRNIYSALALKDSNTSILQFRNDSILSVLTGNDSLQFSYCLKDKNQELIIKEDSANISYHYVTGDSSLQIITADSAFLFFSKKK